MKNSYCNTLNYKKNLYIYNIIMLAFLVGIDLKRARVGDNAIANWNRLPDDIKSITLKSVFKRSVKTHLLNHMGV